MNISYFHITLIDTAQCLFKRWQLFDMTSKKLRILLFVWPLIGCSNNPENRSTDISNESVNSEIVSFNNFVDDVPTTQLPLKIKCGFETTVLTEDFYNKYHPFIPNGFEVVGKIKAKKGLYPILLTRVGDLLYPHLFTFDEKGRQIDSLYLHVSTCGGDPYLELMTWSVIEKDLTIKMTDTAKHFNYIELDSSYTRTLDSTVITQRTIRMNNTGRFIKTNEEREIK
jgi:hypothetical protein